MKRALTTVSLLCALALPAAAGWLDGAGNFDPLAGEEDPKWQADRITVVPQAANGQLAFTWGHHATNQYLSATGITSAAYGDYAGITNPPAALDTNGFTRVVYGDYAGITNPPALLSPSGFLAPVQSYTNTATGTLTWAWETNAYQLAITTTGTLYLAYSGGLTGQDQYLSLSLTVSNARPVVWPTTYWDYNGATSTNSPSLATYNEIMLRNDAWGVWHGVVIYTNATRPQ